MLLAGNPGSPFPGLGYQLAFVHARQVAVVQQLLAANPQMLDAVAAAGIDELLHRVVDRLLGQAGKIEGDHIGQLAQFQRAGLCFQYQCAGAIQGGHTQGAVSVQGSGGAGDLSLIHI